MKFLFVEAHAEVEIEIPEKVVEQLPEHVCLATTVQFMPQIPKIRKYLEEKGKKTSLIKGAHARHDGQILGCSSAEFHLEPETEAIFYIGDGMFHPKALMLGTSKEVFKYDPFAKVFEKLDRKEVDAMLRSSRAGLAKFYHSTRVGVIVSTKPGQNLLKKALKLKEHFKDKKFYYLAVNTLDFNQLENFPFVECFVNTACNRLLDDHKKFPKPMVNLEDIKL